MTDTHPGIYAGPIADSLLHATLEATADGILVVDLEGQIIGRNTRFHRIWAVPAQLQNTGNGELLLRHMCTQVADPDDLLAQIAELTADPERSGRGETRLRDGRVVERYSLPQRLGTSTIGRVWSFRDVTAERDLRAELERRAFTDGLTGISNRAGFLARLDELLAGDEGFVVCLIDLDAFKFINDAYGHRAGDLVLRAVADRLTALLPSETALVARLGGDEYGVLLPSVTAGQAQAFCEAAVASIGEPIALNPGLRGNVTGSAGWTSLRAGHGGAPAEADRLLHEADLAMYQAKESGRSRVVRYSHDLRRLDPLSAWAEVSDLIKDPDAITVAFQPIFSITTGQAVAYEALARFPGRRHREVADWFAAGRSAGLSDVLEAQALRQALLAGAARPAGSQLSVNVSPSALLSTRVRQVLDRDLTGVLVEITEDVRVDLEILGEASRWLTARGAELAIDDAGEGYSGLRRLVQLKPSLVKLDATLISGLDGAPEKVALVEAFVAFCANTNTRLCAEGVSTVEELQTLRRLGVELAQGFVLGRPAPEFAPISEVAGLVCGPGGVARGDLGPALAALTDARDEHDMQHALCLAQPALAVDQFWVTRLAGDLLVDVFSPGATPAMRYQLADYPTTDQVLRTGAPLTVHAGAADTDPGEDRWLRETGHESVLLVPIRTPEGITIGLLECFNRDHRPWTRSDLAAVQALNRRLAHVVESFAAPAD